MRGLLFESGLPYNGGVFPGAQTERWDVPDRRLAGCFSYRRLFKNAALRNGLHA
jgi:hypothetical protein